MASNNTIWVIVIIAALILIGAYFLLSINTKQSSELSPAPSPEATAGEATPTPAFMTEQQVSIINFAFNPTTLTIKRGTRVTWTNQDSVQHTVTSVGNFDSGTFSRGQTYSKVFNTIGTFDYICTVHPFMTGRIIVIE